MVWVRPSNDCGVPDTVFFQTTTAAVPNALSGAGWTRAGCWAMRYCNSLVTAATFEPVGDAAISLSACGSLCSPRLVVAVVLNSVGVGGYALSVNAPKSSTARLLSSLGEAGSLYIWVMVLRLPVPRFIVMPTVLASDAQSWVCSPRPAGLVP